MALSDLYYKLEEKYYASLDWFDSKGLHFFYKIDEWFNSKNIPSFPIMTLLSIVILAAIIVLVLYFAGAFGVSTVDVTMRFVDVSNNVAVPNLSTSFFFNGDNSLQTTNANGEIKIALPKDAIVSVNISSDKYSLKNNTFSFSQDDSVKVELVDKSSMFGPKTLHLYTDLDSKALFSGIVELDLTCTGNSNYIEKKTVVDGIVDINDLPNDCGELQINSVELGLSQTITASQNSLDVLVAGENTKTGILRVIVQDEAGLPIKDIAVAAYSDADFYADSKITSETGFVEFTLSIAKYYLNVSDSGIGDYSSQSTKSSLSPIAGCYDLLNETTPTVCTITMKKANVGKINLLILDVSGQPVKEAQIKIYKNELELVNDSLKEDAKGVYQKGMPELGPYRVVVDSVQYMIYNNPGIMVSDTPTQVVLEAIKDSPVLSVIVTANGEAVANATVQLFKEGNLLVTKTTGADGIAFFDRLESGKVYSAKVVKGEYSQTSSPITLDARLDNKLPVQMIIGKGQIDVSVLDKKGLPVNAQVELYNAFTDKSIGSLTQTDASGLAHFYGVGADKTVYAKITTAKGTSYSLSSAVNANQIVTLNAYASDDSSNFSMDLIGVYNSDGSEIENLPRSVVASNEYYALFLLSVPKGKPYTSGNVFFIGNGKLASESDILIKSVESIYGSETKGLTYTPKKGYAEDMLNKTTDDALWSSLNLSKVNAGQTLVKVNFIITNDPKLNLFSLGYKASLKTGSSVLRYPVDAELGQNESTGDKLGFYADTEKMALKVGDLICVDVACIELRNQDDLQNQTQIYNDDLYATYNSANVMSFKIVPATKQLYKNVTLEVTQKNAGLNILNVSALLNGKTNTVNKESGKFTSLISAFTPTSTIDGSISYNASKAGETLLTISLIAEDKTVLFTKEIKVIVDSPKNLIVEYLPSTIVPYVLNLGAVVVNDIDENLAVSDAIVNVYLNDVVIAHGKTDGDGKFPVQIEKPTAGDILKIVVNGPGYNESITSIKITENILVPDKPEVSVTLDKSESEFANNELFLSTVLPYKLKVKRIGFSANEFSDYVDMKVANIAAGKIFDGNLDLNINAQLTDLGKALLEPKEFKANLELVVTSDDLDKTWNVVIPITIYIRMYDSLDSTNCLNLTLGDYSASEFNFKLTNTCTSGQKQVNLYKARVYAEWVDNKLGEFTFNNKTLETLDENFVLINTVKPKGTNNTTNNFKLGFVDNPAIVSGVSQVNIIVNAYYPTESGLQEITATKDVYVSISDYEKCIQILSPNGTLITTETALTNPIILGVTSYGLGMNMLGGMYNPMLQGMASANGYPMGFGNMMGFGGAGTYLNNGGMRDYSQYGTLLNLQNMSDPTSILAMQQQAQLGAMGTSDMYNNGMSYNNGMNSNYGAQYTDNSMYQQNYNNNSRYGNTAWNNVQNLGNQIYSNDILPTESKILFDFYPASTLGTGVMGAGYGSNYGQYGMNSPYGNGMFGAMMQTSMLPPYNKLTIKNQCTDNVVIEVRAMPQIYVTPTTITVPAKKSSDITVMSSSLPGTYTMNVLAGPDNGSGDLLPLISIPVNVIDYASNTANGDCFKLSEEPTINMSSAYKRNKILKVYNYCYSKGVVFDEAKPVEEHNLFTRKEVVSNMKDKTDCIKSNNALRTKYDAEKKTCNDISDSKKSKNCLDDLGSYSVYQRENQKNCNGLTIDKDLPYVIVTPIGVPQVEYSGTYGQYQVLDIIVEKDPTIKRIIYEQMTSGTSMGDTVSKLSAIRSSLADLYNNVEFPALFVMNARIGYGPTGIQRSIQKLVTVRDLWNLAGAVDILEGVAGGNKSCTPDTWKYGQQITGTIKADTLTDALISKDGTARIPFEDGYRFLDKNCFGTGDSINFNPETVTQTIKGSDGKDFTVEIKPVYNDFKIYFELKMNGCIKEGSINSEINYNINSFNFGGDAAFDQTHKKLNLSFSIKLNKEICVANNIKSETGNVTDTNADNKSDLSKWCATNYGSDWDSLANYGFGGYPTLNYGNMLSFTYDAGKGKEADCSKVFCDAEQLRYYLNNKATFNAKEITEYMNTTINGVAKADFLNASDTNVSEISANKVLDPVSNYFLENLRQELVNKTVQDNIGYYNKIINDMPNLFFKVNVNKGRCDTTLLLTRDIYFKKEAASNLEACYFRAKQFIEKESNLKAFLSENPEFDLVILRQSNNMIYFALNDYTKSDGNAIFGTALTDNNVNSYVVYLKPDDYKLNMGQGAFVADKIVLDVDPQVKTPAAYVVYPYLDNKTKHAVLVKADQYIPKDLTDKFLYNLPVDPNGRQSYTGEYGLCVAKNKLTIKENSFVGTDSCTSSKFAEINSIERKDVASLQFVGTPKLSISKFNLIMPSCTTDCKVTYGTNNTMNYNKDDYYLENIFKTPNNYCYKEDSSSLEIKYGNQN